MTHPFQLWPTTAAQKLWSERKTAKMISKSIPAFPRGVKYRFDAARSAWVVLMPERVFLPDETGHAILSAIDGARTVREIAGELAARFDAPLAVIEADIIETLSELAVRGVVWDRGAAA